MCVGGGGGGGMSNLIPRPSHCCLEAFSDSSCCKRQVIKTGAMQERLADEANSSVLFLTKKWTVGRPWNEAID